MAKYIFSDKFTKLYPNILINEQMEILPQVLCVALLCVSRVFTAPLCHLVERRITGFQSKKKLASCVLKQQWYVCSSLPVVNRETGRGLERLYRPAESLKFWFMRKNKFLYPHTQTETQRLYPSTQRASQILTRLIKRYLILKYQITGVWLLIAV